MASDKEQKLWIKAHALVSQLESVLEALDPEPFILADKHSALRHVRNARRVITFAATGGKSSAR